MEWLHVGTIGWVVGHGGEAITCFRLQVDAL